MGFINGLSLREILLKEKEHSELNNGLGLLSFE